MPQSIFPEVLLNTGRMIRAVSLHIDQTYFGLLAGLPGEKINHEIVSYTQIHAEGLVIGAPILVIDPPRERLSDESKPHGNHVKIPEFRIIAEFVSDVMGTDGVASSLVIAWFEPATEPLMSERTRKRVAEIDWENLARDFEP